MELLAPLRVNNRFYIHKAQSLIEIVVAVGIIAVVLVGVSDLITRSLSLASFQAGKNEAVTIAQSQLNYFRQKKDENPDLFFESGLVSDCMIGYDEEKYDCEVVYSNLLPNSSEPISVDMTVSVTWQNGSNSIVTELSQTLVKPPK